MKYIIARLLGGMQWFCNIPRELFHPKGRSPEGWNYSQGMLQNHCIPTKSRAVVFLYSLLNRQIRWKSWILNKRMHKNTWFHKRVLKTLISRKNFVKLNKPWCNLLLQKTFATSHGIKSFAKNLCNKNFVNLTEKLICKGNFIPIVYLVNHVEISFTSLIPNVNYSKVENPARHLLKGLQSTFSFFDVASPKSR